MQWLTGGEGDRRGEGLHEQQPGHNRAGPAPQSTPAASRHLRSSVTVKCRLRPSFGEFFE
jgi:hypothetical protein